MWLDGVLANLGDGLRDLDGWLEPFLDVMGRKTRREWAPFYVRGLLGPSERKSLQLMAARLGLPGHDQLQHFVASTAWDDGPLWTVPAQEADRLVGGPGGHLVIDDTALPKIGYAVGGRCAPILRAGGQAGELPVAGVALPGAGRGSGAGGLAAVPARGVDG